MDARDSVDDDDVDRPDLTRLAGPAPRPSPGAWWSALVADLGLSVRSVVLTAVVGLLLAGVAWWWWHDPPPSAAEATLPLAAPLTDPGPTSSLALEEVIAHAAGAVHRPGVYTLAAGARVADLIEAAGGAVRRADLDRVNLAAPLADGAQVHVPLLGEATGNAPIGGEGITEGSTPLVDLNTAGAEELETLPGVGPATSAAIIAHREEHGPFASVDDLIAVSGIGDAKLAAVRDLVTV